MNIALILSGGVGSRFGGEKPKQLVLLGEKPVLAHTVEAFNKNHRIEKIIVVSNADWLNETKKMLDENFSKCNIEIIAGGESRRESCYVGLQYIMNTGGSQDDIVLIHDGARPFVSQQLIEKNIDMAVKHGAVVTALQSSDSVFFSDDGEGVTTNFDRNRVYFSQTPQSFKMEHILKAHERYKNDNTATDDASLVSAIGVEVKIALGEKSNKKITTVEDM